MEDVDREISEMKLSLNARARIVAESYLGQVSLFPPLFFILFYFFFFIHDPVDIMNTSSNLLYISGLLTTSVLFSNKLLFSLFKYHLRVKSSISLGARTDIRTRLEIRFPENTKKQKSVTTCTFFCKKDSSTYLPRSTSTHISTECQNHGNFAALTKCKLWTVAERDQPVCRDEVTS